jgi:hypothetical protein
MTVKSIPWAGEGTPDLGPTTPVRPQYRGPEDLRKGDRIRCAPVARLDWSHDGGPDDIIAYSVEDHEEIAQ